MLCNFVVDFSTKMNFQKQPSRSALRKSHFYMGVLQCISRIFSERLSLRTSLDGCLSTFKTLTNILLQLFTYIFSKIQKGLKNTWKRLHGSIFTLLLGEIIFVLQKNHTLDSKKDQVIFLQLNIQLKLIKIFKIMKNLKQMLLDHQTVRFR